MLERNKVHCGDCLELMKQMPDKSVDLVLTDPPYQIEGNDRGMGANRAYLREGMANIGTFKDTDIYSDGSLVLELIRICKKPNIILFCNKAQIRDILNNANEFNLSFELLFMGKTAPTPLTNNQWLPDREFIIHLFKNKKVLGNYSTKQGFFIDSSFKDEGIDHPTPKPLWVIKKIMLNTSEQGDLILDPFLGSGTTAVACKELGRNFIGIEKEQKYVDMANKRLSQTSVSLF